MSVPRCPYIFVHRLPTATCELEVLIRSHQYTSHRARRIMAITPNWCIREVGQQVPSPS